MTFTRIVENCGETFKDAAQMVVTFFLVVTYALHRKKGTFSVQDLFPIFTNFYQKHSWAKMWSWCGPAHPSDHHDLRLLSESLHNT